MTRHRRLVLGSWMSLVVPGLLLAVPVQALAQAAGADVFDDVSATSVAGPSAAQLEEAAAKPEDKSWEGRNAFEVWEEEHRWFRLGLRAYAVNPAIQEHAALRVGAALTVPLTTDFFMGIGMRLAFHGGYLRGGSTDPTAPNYCTNHGGVGDDLQCPDGHTGGIDFTWKEPDAGSGGACDGVFTPEDRQPRSTFVGAQRRLAHVAYYALTIGGNYELTIPSVGFFRVFQPYVGGGVVLAWVYTYSDILADECYLIDNEDNDPFDPDNVDPWASQGPAAGGEIYGGFHLNLDKVFRFAFELGYLNVPVESTLTGKSTPEFEMKHLGYRLQNFRFGGGIEFRF